MKEKFREFHANEKNAPFRCFLSLYRITCIFRTSLHATVYSYVLYIHGNLVQIFSRNLGVAVKLRNFSNAAADVIIFNVDYCLQLCFVCSRDGIFFIAIFAVSIFIFNLLMYYDYNF